MDVSHNTNIYIDIYAILILLILFISNRKRKYYLTFDQKIFNITLLFNIFVFLIEAATWFFDLKSFQGAREINIISTFILYLLYPLICFIWTIYIDYRVYDNLIQLKRRIKLYIIPVIINIVFCIITLFVPFLYKISAENEFIRIIPYSYFSFIIPIVYFIYLFILLTINRKKIKRDYFPLVLYMIIPIICVIIQSFFYGLALMTAGFTISITIVSLKVQNNRNTTDFLTGVNNRRSLEDYLMRECNHVKEGYVLYGIMLDIDNFKKINDIFGHVTGDNALEQLCNILKRAIRSTDFISRYAGDEFIIISILKQSENIETIVDKIIHKKDEFNDLGVVPYIMEFSIGYSEYYQDEHYETFLNRLDKRMYENKNLRKSNSSITIEKKDE